jgi:hypothetical protein
MLLEIAGLLRGLQKMKRSSQVNIWKDETRGSVQRSNLTDEDSFDREPWKGMGEFCSVRKFVYS